MDTRKEVFLLIRYTGITDLEDLKLILGSDKVKGLQELGIIDKKNHVVMKKLSLEEENRRLWVLITRYYKVIQDLLEKGIDVPTKDRLENHHEDKT